MKKEMAQLMKTVLRTGARVEDRGVRWLVYCPDGVTIVTIHKTPSDGRALKNTKADLRRGGIAV